MNTPADIEKDDLSPAIDPLEAIDEYADSVGLPQHVVLELIEATIESLYRDLGQQVRAYCKVEDGEFSARVFQIYTAPDGFQDCQIIENPLPISEERFRAVVDFYLEFHSGHWLTDPARLISISDDGYYILSLTGTDDPQDCVVLPSRKKGAVPLQMGETYYLAYKRFREKDVHPGIEPYYQTGISHIGTRSDSLFLRILFQKFYSFSDPVHAEIAMQAGMVVLPQSTDLSTIIGPNGTRIKLLAQLAGLERVSCVIEPPPGRKPQSLIRYACRHIAGVNGVRVSETPIIEDGFRYWRLTVPESKRSRLIGKNGANAILIMSLAGETILI